MMGSQLAPRSAFLLAAVLLGSGALAQSPRELAEEAGKAMQRQYYPAAEKAYRQFLKLSPDVAEAYSNLGLACYLQKKYPPAEEAFAKALRLESGLFLPNFLLSQIRFQQGRYQEALPLIRKARAAQPRQKEVRQLYTATLVGLKLYDAAIAEYQQALAWDPDDADSYYGLGSVYLLVGSGVMERLSGDNGFGSLLTAQHYAPTEQWQGAALAAYQAAIGKPAGIQGVRVAYARLLFARKDWTGARQSLEEELRLDPNSYEARFHLARVALAQGNLEEAVQRLEEAVHIRPEFFQPLPELGVLDVAGFRERLAGLASRYPFPAAYLLAKLGSDEGKQWAQKAEGARNRILRALPTATGTSEQDGLDLLTRKRYEQGLAVLLPLTRGARLKPETELEMARGLFRTGRYEDTIRVFGKADRGVPEINFLLGASHKEVALQMLTRMAQLAPDSARSHQVLGDAYFAEDRFYDALGEYEAAVKLQPENPELHFLLGNSYFKQMQFSLALESFERTLRLDPLNAEAYLMKGDSLVQLGETADAAAALEKSLELEPNLAQAHLLLGKAYSGEGKLERALPHLEKGATADKDGTVHYQLFLLYRKLNQPEKAREALRRSQELRQAAPKPVVEAAPHP